MSMILDDTKEDLHGRMAELEKKLRDSEEERRKLEKTCEILIKAFKEEQRMCYDALNMRYEKFLEDCNVRRRRNDIILKSLCRVEDRAKAIYAKTEKLKLLKDRYISYLKQNDFLKNEEPKKRVSSSSPPQAVQSNETDGKSVHWRSPVIAHVQEYSPQTLANAHKQIPEKLFLMKSTEPLSATFSNADLYNSPVEGIQPLGLSAENTQLTMANPDTGNDRIIMDRPITIDKTSPSSGTSRTTDSSFPSQSPINHFTSIKQNNSEITSNIKTNPDFGTIEVSKGEALLTNQESIAPTADHGSAPEGRLKIRPEETENIDRAGMLHQPSLGVPQLNDFHSDTEEESPRGGPTYIKGLDGVDYQNETYPESYYEQPVHSHNYSSLASNVILEEDEYDLEEDQVGGYGPSASCSRENPLEASDFHREAPPLSSSANDGKPSSPPIRADGRITEPKGLVVGSTDNPDKGLALGGPAKTSLMQLLESDSESFQIEHGDMISGNDDSDFDFSFGQNQE